MKIVCDACQAKYSISDDKVQGKVFKIRCKKCSNIIVVRGGAQAAEAPAPAATDVKDTRVYDYGYEGGAGGGEESVWHVVINQDQVGPMTAAEVQQRFSAGEIDAETYAWREGFADWLPLSQVDAFASFLATASTTSAAGSGAAAVSSMFGNDESGTVRSDPGDLFAAASAGSSSRGTDDDGDLFGSKPSKASQTSTQAAAEAKLRGERNENSVLFSLNNLAQLASDKPAPNPGVSSMPSGHATGAAGGEGSGLIDIRSMANAYLGGSGAAAKTATASTIGSIDDLPVFGGGGFSEPAVIVPTASRGQNNKMMYALIGSVAFLAIAAVIMIIVLLKGGDDKKVVVAQGDTKESSAEGKTDDTKADTKTDTPTTNTASSEQPATNEGSAAEPAAKTDEPKATEPVKTEEPKADPKKTEPKKTDPKKTTAAVAKTEPKKTEPKTTAPKEAASAGGCDEVSCVLNNYEGACCAKFKKKSSGGGTATTKSSGGGDLPDGLDRAMISDGVNKVKAKVQACGDKSSAKGQVKVSVKVNPGGDVASVAVKNTPDAGLGNCVAAAMQKAKFAKTQNGGSFGYPFMF